MYMNSVGLWMFYFHSCVVCSTWWREQNTPNRRITLFWEFVSIALFGWNQTSQKIGIEMGSRNNLIVNNQKWSQSKTWVRCWVKKGKTWDIWWKKEIQGGCWIGWQKMALWHVFEKLLLSEFSGSSWWWSWSTSVASFTFKRRLTFKFEHESSQHWRNPPAFLLSINFITFTITIITNNASAIIITITIIITKMIIYRYSDYLDHNHCHQTHPSSQGIIFQIRAILLSCLQS